MRASWTVLVVVMAGLGCHRSEMLEERPPPPITVTGAEAGWRDLSRRIEVAGRVEPLRQVDLASPMQGILAELRVEEGDQVEAGELLAGLDLAEVRAQFDRAAVLLEQATIAYRRSRELRQVDVASLSEYELAAAELEVRRSELALWKNRVELGEVKAPFAGVITQKYVEAGGAVSLNQPLLALADPSLWVVRVGLSELDVVALEIGQTVTVRFDAHDDLEVPGTIRRIFPAADPRSRLFPVEVAVQPGTVQQPVRFGFLARVRVEIDNRPNVLAVPVTALHQDDEAAYVWVIEAERNRVRRQRVQPGIERGGWREIRLGLEPGERIVASPQVRLQEGDSVRIVRWTGGTRWNEGAP